MLLAALMSPRPPELMALNEPENSLHPDLLPALGRLIATASRRGQIIVVSHASRLLATLKDLEECRCWELEKDCGETTLKGLKLIDLPPWNWPER
jgi:predicted ATPase